MADFRDYFNMKRIYPLMMEKNPELEKAGKIQTCYKIIVPIMTIQVDIEQTPNESFEEIEKLIVRLINAQINNPKEIAQLSGIPVTYIENIISILITQKLLTEDGKNLTQNGQISLQTEKKHISITEKREFQINGITFNIIPKKFQIYKEELLKISQIEEKEMFQNPTCEMLQVIEDNKWEEIEENIKQYVEILNEISSSNVKNISISEIADTSYTYLFLIKFENLQQPIIIAKTAEFTNNIAEFSYKPMWIYQQDAKYLGIEEKEIIGKNKTNIIQFEHKIEEIYKPKEETIRKYLEKWQVKNKDDITTYEIELKGDEYNKDLLYEIEKIGNQEPQRPIFPDSKTGLNGEVFYFYTKDSERYEKMKEIAKVVCLYMKEVKDNYGNAKEENCKKENKEIIIKVAN